MTLAFATQTMNSYFVELRDGLQTIAAKPKNTLVPAYVLERAIVAAYKGFSSLQAGEITAAAQALRTSRFEANNYLTIAHSAGLSVFDLTVAADELSDGCIDAIVDAPNGWTGLDGAALDAARAVLADKSQREKLGLPIFS